MTATRRRGRPEQISEAQIIDAALRMARRVGVEGLTMRRLAEELGVTTMAAYHHVPNKDGVIRLVADAVLSRVDVTPQPDMPWDEQIWRIASANLKEFDRYPGLAYYLTHHELLPAGRRQMEQSIAILIEAGFTAEDARQAYAAIYSYMWGRLALRSQLGDATRRATSGRATTPTSLQVQDLVSLESIELGYRALVLGLSLSLPSTAQPQP
jgi:TetR/AcrR family tetracycline transcriptional repressor